MITAVSIYKNIQTSDLLIIPESNNEDGLIAEIDKPLWLKPPLNNKDIGQAVKVAIAEAQKTPLLPGKNSEYVLLEETKLKNLKQIGRCYICVGICDWPGGEDNLPSPLKERKKEVQSYYFKNNNFYAYTYYPHFQLDYDCTDEELGATILKAFDAIATIRDK